MYGYSNRLRVATMSLADYLAKNYLTADSKQEKKSKKRKRKDGGLSGLIISDDDTFGWANRATIDNEDDAPLDGKQHLHCKTYVG